jgi:glucose/arabinose dehydrogenase
MRTLFSAIVIIAVTAVLAAAAGPARVSLVGSPPALVAGRAWTATLRTTGSGTPVLSATNGRRSLRFHVRHVRAHRFRARIVIPAAGRWRLAARLGGKRFRLATLRVSPAPAYRLDEPGQVLATPDGSLLVAERGSRERITLVHPQDGEVSVFAPGLPQPYGLAFAPDRTILVSTVNGVFRVPAHGGRPARIVGGDLGPLLSLDARTVLYGRRDEIGRLDLETGRTQPFGPPVTAPHSLALAPDGRLLVTDSAGRILAVDLASGASTIAADGLRTPLGMITDAVSSILVLEYGAGTLVRVGPGGSKTTVASGFRRPYSLALGRDGNVYVVEAGDLGAATGTLERVTPDGRVSRVKLHD